MTKKVKVDSVSVGSLQGKQNFAVRLVSNVVAETHSQNGMESAYPYTFKDEVLFVTKIENHNLKEHTYIYWMNFATGIPQHTAVANGFQVILLSDKEATKITKEYKQSIKDNLDKSLTHYFMSGADPEIFVEREDGTVLPAFEFLPSKEKAKPISIDASIYWDGFQAEFTTRAYSCLVSFTAGIIDTLSALNELVKAKDPKAKLSAKTVVDVRQDVLESANEEHVSLGCAPSLNIYGMKGKLEEPRKLKFRPAGGHLHFGIGKKDEAIIARIVKSLDMVTGVACVSLFAKFDDPRRRELYGLAGEYRLPAHGIEYRTLSNAWLFHPVILNIVFDLARTAVMLGELDLMDLWNATEEETIRCINTCDVTLAREILTRNKNVMVKMLSNRYKTKGMAAKAFNIYLEGMESVVKNPADIEGNWNLNKTTKATYYHYVNAFSHLSIAGNKIA